MNNNYYMLTDNNTGKLNKVIYNSTTGKATGYSKDAADDIKLQLNISHKYIGSNTVKMIYTLKNTGTGSLSNLKLGGTGDIKIGADDTAAIEPLNEGDKQVGFYMKSGKEYDKSSSDDYFDGEKYTQEDDNYTVRKYGLDVLDKTTKEIQDYSTNHSEQYDKLAYLVKTMLDYGTKAQIVFNHNNSEDKFANKDIGYSMSDVNPTAFDNAIKDENGNKTKSDMTSGTDSFGLKYYNTSVVFLSRTSLRHYYTITDKNTYDKYKNGASFKVYENKPPYVYFELQDIPAAKLDQLQEFKIGEQTYYFSVLDFAKGLLDDGRSTAQKDLGKATYWYNQAANSFFGE